MLKSELHEIDVIKQNNIEFEFVLKAMKIAVCRYDVGIQSFVYENDYREGINNYVPKPDESYRKALSSIAPVDVNRVGQAFSDICEGT